MEAEALRSAVEHAGLAAAGIGFLAGLAFGFNPVALASIPVSLAYVTKDVIRAKRCSTALCLFSVWCSPTSFWASSRARAANGLLKSREELGASCWVLS